MTREPLSLFSLTRFYFVYVISVAMENGLRTREKFDLQTQRAEKDSLKTQRQRISLLFYLQCHQVASKKRKQHYHNVRGVTQMKGNLGLKLVFSKVTSTVTLNNFLLRKVMSISIMMFFKLLL
jgi:hypothetical protein